MEQKNQYPPRKQAPHFVGRPNLPFPAPPGPWNGFFIPNAIDFSFLAHRVVAGVVFGIDKQIGIRVKINPNIHGNPYMYVMLLPELEMVIPWFRFPPAIKNMESELRFKITQQRLPIGTTFSVFINTDQYGALQAQVADRAHPTIPKPFFTTPPSQTSEKPKLDLKYKYLVVVDLEATCDFSPQPEVNTYSAEIIEFPWVLFDLEKQEIVSKSQIYVKPDNINGITPYCRVLTGITEETVEKSPNLESALKTFTEFVEKELPTDSFRIITDGVWDIQVQLRGECTRKNISLDKPYFKEHLDLREEFRKFFPWFSFKPTEPSLHIMVQALQLEFVGRHHSGLDDCLTIIEVVKRMMKLGCEFDCLIPVTDNPYYLGFPSLASSDCWKCEICSEKWKDKEVSTTNKFRAVWNKASSSVCRFCSGYRPTDKLEINCEKCGGKVPFSEEEMKTFQAKKWHFPKRCLNCKFLSFSVS